MMCVLAFCLLGPTKHTPMMGVVCSGPHRIYTHAGCECLISSVIVIHWSLVYGGVWAPALLLFPVSGVPWLVCTGPTANHCQLYLGGKERKHTVPLLLLQYQSVLLLSSQSSVPQLLYSKYAK